MTQSYSIQEAAKQTGVSAHTLRYYERIGLIKAIVRNGSGHRQYSEDNLSWVSLLTCLRETGMSIQQMLKFVALVDGGEQTIPARCALLEAHHHDVTEHIKALQQHLQVIEGKLGHYQNHLKAKIG